jgi:hypothetical protein
MWDSMVFVEWEFEYYVGYYVEEEEDGMYLESSL